jgi:hypothetical protein
MYSKNSAGIILSFILSYHGNFTHTDERAQLTVGLKKQTIFTAVADIPVPTGFKRTKFIWLLVKKCRTK